MMTEDYDINLARNQHRKNDITVYPKDRNFKADVEIPENKMLFHIDFFKDMKKLYISHEALLLIIIGVKS
jgi:hypothetical protein